GMLQRLPVSANRFQGRCANGNLAFLFSFAANANELLVAIQVFRPQSAKFADTQATGINCFEQSGVPMESRTVELGSTRLLEPFQFASRRAQQIEHLLSGQKFRKAPRGFWHGDALDWGGFGVSTAHQEFVEGAECAEAKHDGGATFLLPSQKAQISAKIVASE